MPTRTHILIDPQGTRIADVAVSDDRPGFLDIHVTALKSDLDNCLIQTSLRSQTSGLLTEWIQVVADNPATRALCDLLLDSQALNKASGNCVFADYVAKIISAIDALWD